jgi:hypothetical protein
MSECIQAVADVEFPFKNTSSSLEKEARNCQTGLNED